MRHILVLILCLVASNLASAKAPAAPTNLRVKALGVNSFRMEWKDNSNNEKGWEIRVALGAGSKPARYVLLPSPDATSYVVLTNELAGKALTFQVAAYNGESGKEKFSKPSKIVTATALASATFGDPLKLTAKTLDDGRIRLKWKEKSTSEQGYEIQSKQGSGKWKTLGNTNADVSFNLDVGGFLPQTAYSFRVRAFKQNPLAYTKFSNVATATTQSFQKPSAVVAKAEPDGAISLKWKDNSAIESGYEIQFKTGTSEFSKLGQVGTNVNSTSQITGFSFDTDYQIRIRGVRLVDGAPVYTEFSNVASIRTLPLAPPTGLTASVVNDTSVKLTWAHASSRELGCQIQYRETGAEDYLGAGSVAADVNEFIVTGLTSGKSYEFQVRAFDYVDYSSFSPVAQSRTKDGIVGLLNPPILVGSHFLYPIQTSLPASLTNLSVVGLPAGLVYNAATRAITGILATGGVYSLTLTATFSDGSTSTRTLTLRSTSGQPVITSNFASVSVPAATENTVSLDGKFTDPDTASAARVTTTMGTFDIILFPFATPKTVNNFLDYVDAGLYENGFFHRSISNFIVQGGGYRHTDQEGYSRVATYPSVANEPGLSSIKGTVAMAKVDGFPDSATSQWFVNVNDNSAELDVQNSGFTVFGRVPVSGMVLLDQINDLPSGNYDIPIGANVNSLENVPMNLASAPLVLDPATLVKITSVDAAPILTYEVTSENEAVATAVLNGTEIIITGQANGSTKINVKATDLDGQSVSQKITVTVP